MESPEKIDMFFDATAYGVVGASANRDKYGNMVLRCYQQNGYRVIPVNPKEPEIEGIPCVATVAELPGEVQSISVVTPPAVTEKVVEQAIQKGIRHIWMQPGSESAAAVARCEQSGVNVIADGSCLLVVLGCHGS